jgi:hypothetical protein
MLICMRTTLEIDDGLVREVKRRAAETGRTMTEVIEEALREGLRPPRRPEQTEKLRWRTVSGRVRPGVDVNDRDALYDLMERSG